MTAALNLWVVMDIGCIECGEPSNVRLFRDRGVALAWLVKERTAQKDDWHGQHHFQLWHATVDGSSVHQDVEE